jgi:hypothetical protein
MLEDHASRWTAAASPGGLIGLVLTILSIMAIVAAVLSITDRFAIPLDDLILYVILGVAVMAGLVFLYLLIAYLTISYRLDPEKLTIKWGLWSTALPFEQIVAVAPAMEVLGDQPSGWQLFWPGYYVGSRNTEIGKINVLATLPPRRQVLVARSDGEVFAISPERPLLFMEELARLHDEFRLREPERFEPESGDVSMPETAAEARSSGAVPVTSPDPHPEPVASPSDSYQTHPPLPSAESIPSEERTDQTFGSAPLQPEPVRHWEASPVIDDEPHREPAFGVQPAESTSDPLDDADTARYQLPQPPVDEEQAFGVATPVPPEAAPVEALSEPDEDVAEEELPAAEPPPDVWSPPRPADGGHPISVQQFVDAGWTAEQPVLDVVHDPRGVMDRSQHEAPAYHDRADAPVLQPLTRVHRSRPAGTSPALRPTLIHDPVALALAAVGLLATAAMVIYVLVQYQDIPPSLTLHWNVDGLPGRVGEPREIWILPIIAGMVLVANIALAWSIAMFDRFAARLMLGSTIIVHLVTWIALIMLLR